MGDKMLRLFRNKKTKEVIYEDDEDKIKELEKNQDYQLFYII
jgi:hypothetical protein